MEQFGTIRSLSTRRFLFQIRPRIKWIMRVQKTDYQRNTYRLAVLLIPKTRTRIPPYSLPSEIQLCRNSLSTLVEFIFDQLVSVESLNRLALGELTDLFSVSFSNFLFCPLRLRSSSATLPIHSRVRINKPIQADFYLATGSFSLANCE